MQTILGAGGPLSIELAKALTQYGKEIRLVSRTPQKVNSTDQLFSADLTNMEETSRAVDGSEVVYLTVGIPYNTNRWQTEWPQIMKNVIEACKSHQAKLVFFDNIYMYDPNHLGHMTEQAAINPVSKKGAVRAQLAKMILDEVENGGLKALIARSADFYGPAIQNNSMLTETVFKNLGQSKKATWLSSAAHKHSFTFIPDAAKATAMLGNTPDAYNQVWHLPTATNPLTGQEWIEAIAQEMGVEPKYRVVSKFMMQFIGFFAPAMRETVEMMYQYDRDYIFDSSKFDNRFNFEPTSYQDGIRQIVQHDYQSKVYA